MLKRGAGVLISLFVLLNAYADEGRVQAQEQAIAKAQSAVSADNYRQQLGKTIVVEEEYFPQELDVYARFMPLAGAKSQSGKVGLVTAASEYNYKIKAFGKIPVEFGVATKYIGIDNTTAVSLPGRLTAFGLGLETTLPFFNFNKTYFTIGVAPSFFTDNWNFRSESFHLLQHYFMIYQPNEKLTLICGVDYAPGFKAPVSPIVGLIYRPNEKLTFNLIPANPEISYDLNDRWTVFAQGAYVGDEYKVTQNNLKNVVLNYNEMRAGTGIRYFLSKNMEGSLAVGSVFNRSIEYRQDSLGKVALKAGFYSEFRVNISI
ncbi:MAG: DUF6268 family outer membrane beta-barrel protein [Candidatus Omnitrophota bacterium]|nr:DUF6268 family outer membrane beta-barrel protein [Candidatus Omnitrophota bacterium]